MEKYDLALTIALLIGTAFYSAYMCEYTMNFSAKSDYKVYDGASVASANWLLPVRQNSSTETGSPAYLSPRLLKELNLTLPVTNILPGRYEYDLSGLIQYKYFHAGKCDRPIKSCSASPSSKSESYSVVNGHPFHPCGHAGTSYPPGHLSLMTMLMC